MVNCGFDTEWNNVCIASVGCGVWMVSLCRALLFDFMFDFYTKCSCCFGAEGLMLIVVRFSLPHATSRKSTLTLIVELHFGLWDSCWLF